MISLGLSCLALLLAIFPPCIFEKKIQELEKIHEDASTAFSFEITTGRLNFFGVEENASYMTEAEAGRIEVEKLKKNFRVLTCAMIFSAFAAVFTAICSFITEHGKEICIWSIITASVALSWQYVGTNVAVGTALLVFIMLAAGCGHDPEHDAGIFEHTSPKKKSSC